MEAIYSKDYIVDTFTSNSHKRLGLLGLVGILQDIASFHSKDAGFGTEEMLSKGVFWALIRKSIKMQKWPALFSLITVKTWSRMPDSFYAYRDFEIYHEGELIGSATTTWVTLNVKSRRPCELPLEDLTITPRTQGCLDYFASKVKFSEQLSQVTEFTTRNSDLDLNGHVNNTKYTQWILDSVDYKHHDSKLISEYHINFLSEVKLGDKIEVYRDSENSDALSKVSFVGKVPDHKKPSMVVALHYRVK